MFTKETLDKLKDIHAIKPLDAVRGIDLKAVILDVCKRDSGDGTYNIDLIVYVRPDVNPARIMPAVQKTCIDMFGHKVNEHLLPFYHPGHIDGKAISVEVAGKPSVCVSFGVSILHPLSLYTSSIEELKHRFAERVYFNLMNPS